MGEIEPENPLPGLQELFETWKKKDAEKDRRIESLESEIEILNKIIVEFVDPQPMPSLTEIKPV